MKYENDSLLIHSAWAKSPKERCHASALETEHFEDTYGN